MDSKQLHCILEIARQGSISKASQKLFISPSGLNQLLSRMEKEMGVQLFQRDTHHLFPTEAGKIYLRFAQDVLGQEKQVRTLMQDAVDNNVGEIRLNLAMEEGIALFSKIFPAFHEKFPRIEFKLEDHTVKEQYKLLQEQQLDIGMVMVGNVRMKEIQYVPIMKERLLLGIPESNQLALQYGTTNGKDYPIIPLSLCKEEPFSLMFADSTYREIIDPCFEAAGFQPNIIFESRTNHFSGLMISNNICLSFLPESHIWQYPHVKWFRIPQNPTWEGCLIYRKDMPPRKAGQYLIKLALKQKAVQTIFFQPVV